MTDNYLYLKSDFSPAQSLERAEIVVDTKTLSYYVSANRVKLKHRPGGKGHDQSTHGRWAQTDAAFSQSIRGGIVKAEPLVGGLTKNESKLIRFEDGTEGVWKPESAAGSAGHFGASEVIAYRISSLLGLRVVPETEYMDYQGKRGTVQRWVKGDLLGVLPTEERERLRKDKQIRQQMYNTVLLDFITGNVDRNMTNFIVDREKKTAHAIDNGNAVYHNRYDTAERAIRNLLGQLSKTGSIRLSKSQLRKLKGITPKQFGMIFYGASKRNASGSVEVNPGFCWKRFRQIVRWGGLSWTISDAEVVKIGAP